MDANEMILFVLPSKIITMEKPRISDWSSWLPVGYYQVINNG